MKKDENEMAADVLHDLDQMTGLAGKEWSVALAKKLGLNAKEIELYLSKPSSQDRK